MGAPKNFYNAVDQKKLGTDKIDTIITTIGNNTSGIIGHLNSLSAEVSEIVRLPSITISDAGRVLSVNNNGEWAVTKLSDLAGLSTDVFGIVEATYTEV